MSRVVSLLFVLFFTVLSGSEFDFELYDMKDKIITLKKILEKPETKIVVVDFISMYCEPCKKAIPEWNVFYKEYKAKGLEIIAIALPSQDDRSKEALLMKKFFQKNETAFPYIYDKYSVVGKSYKVVDKDGNAVVPNIFLIGKDGSLIMNSTEHQQVISRIKEILPK